MGDLTERSTYSADMSSEEISYFLRQIADEIEGKPVELQPHLSIKNFRDFKKLGIKLKREAGRFSLNLTVKYDGKSFNKSDDKGEHKESGHGRLKKYRAGKKRLKPLFKDIYRSVSNGELPSAGLIKSFFRDSDQMISFHGEDYYKDYIAACEEFRIAINTGDIAAAKAGCEKIRQIKSECHKKHK